MSTRDRSLDVFKGLLAGLMVYCHVLQFFGHREMFPIINTYETLINLAVFPGFVFAFGCAVSLAYLDKPFVQVWPRMLRAAVKPLGAFYLSGIAFRLLRENKPFAMNTVRRVLLLQDIPGWSEFLLAFALYGLLAMALFVPLGKLRTRPYVAVAVSALCLAGCFLPYGSIHSTYAGLLVGTRDHVTFPVLQYAPYFLLGVVYPHRNRRYTWVWAACAAVATAVGALLWWQGGLSERFPPSIGWVLLPTGISAALLALSWALCRIPLGRFARVSPLIPVVSMGRNSLFYLLGSNLAIFTLAGKNMTPWLKTVGGGLWGLPIQSPWGAACWTAVLLLCLGFVAWLVSGAPRAAKKEVSA